MILPMCSMGRGTSRRLVEGRRASGGSAAVPSTTLRPTAATQPAPRFHHAPGMVTHYAPLPVLRTGRIFA